MGTRYAAASSIFPSWEIKYHKDTQACRHAPHAPSPPRLGSLAPARQRGVGAIGPFCSLSLFDSLVRSLPIYPWGGRLRALPGDTVLGMLVVVRPDHHSVTRTSVGTIWGLCVTHLTWASVFWGGTLSAFPLSMKQNCLMGVPHPEQTLACVA